MKNPNPYIRQQLFALLSGINYDNAVVPVYEGGGVAGLKYQVLIADQSGTPENTRQTFGHDIDQVIEVVYEGTNNVRKHIDAIGEAVMQRLKPTPRAVGIPNSEQWQIINLRVNTPHYLDDVSGSGTIIKRLILRIEIQILER